VFGARSPMLVPPGAPLGPPPLEHPFAAAAAAAAGTTGRGLHSSSFQLNLSRFLSLTPHTDTEYPTKRAYVKPRSGQV